MYYRRTNGILIVYDITDQQSFDNIRAGWLRQIEMYANENICMILVANKCDVEDEEKQVSFDTGKKLADELGIDFFEVSAL